MYIEDIGETGIIEKIANLVGVEDEDIIVSIGDDAAVVRSPSNYYTVLTTDFMIEKVHFDLSTISAYQLGRKSMLVNISDIAAMSAIPTYALISLGIKPKTKVNFIEELYEGMVDVSKEYDFKIVGGDTVASPCSLSINIAMVGKVEPHLLRKRADAKVGDKVLVTGKLGASSAGLFLLNSKIKGDEYLIKSHLEPVPRLKEARLSAICGAHAMEDISDGLASEIYHICNASRVGAVIHEESLPIANGVKGVAEIAKKPSEYFVLYGGEDYEIVLTVGLEKMEKLIHRVYSETGTTLTLVGEIIDEQKGVYVLKKDGSKRPLTKGYDHFRKEEL
ncbi:thiamine-phosphate kinase [Candidatus Oleimmundimicrobium sp.]|uniref:thiamine-phosphate kinase n=1 Tax=Candidatus Oleimmundimicrobium sp. TaxID=3060597 RepID=UPI00272293D8|nr:thiamine-phosphate kinase [Candidatus Oleimmundimicrobium sp.]MDO8885336.1 thiamine-phosphate kinase [Candidatus Oleimmundimicrobium sp.]